MYTLNKNDFLGNNACPVEFQSLPGDALAALFGDLDGANCFQWSPDDENGRDHSDLGQICPPQEPTLLLSSSKRDVHSPSPTSPRRTRKKRDGRLRRTTKEPPMVDVREVEACFTHASRIGKPFNRLVTIVPAGMNDLAPADRSRVWYGVLNLVGQFGRNRGIELAFAWSRESERDTGNDEHMHVCLHVPPGHVEAFEEAVGRWAARHGWDADVRPASHARSWVDGKERSLSSYLTKNSWKACHNRPSRSWEPGGPIVGARTGCSANLSPKSRARWEAKRERSSSMVRPAPVTVDALEVA